MAKKAEESTYSARLTIGDQHVCTITLRAKSDDEAKKQLERSKPAHFEGLGEWTLTKTEYVEVK